MDAATCSYSPESDKESEGRELEQEEFDSEPERDNDLQQPTFKRRKFHGAAMYSTKFDPAWKTKFPCVKPVKKDEFSFLCTVCNKVISCKHQGVKDVKRHIEGLNHSKLAKGADRQCTLAFRKSSDPISGKVSIL